MATSNGPKRAPATTPQGRENQLINYAIDLAEKQLKQGTASATVITHYLKLASSREQLEQQRLKYEGELLKAKTQSEANGSRQEELAKAAIKAMRGYQGGLDALEADDDPNVF